MTQRSAIWMVIGAATLWSMAGVLIKSIDWDPLAIAGARSFIAGIFLFTLIRPSKQEWHRSQIWAALAYAATVILFVTANKLTTSANAILLQYTSPIYVALLAPIFLGEVTKRIDWFAVIVALIGMSLFFVDHLAFNHFRGDVIAILSGVAFAFLTVFLRKQKDGNPHTSIILGNALAALLAAPAMIKAGLPSSKSASVLLFAGIFQLGLSYFLYSKAIRKLEALEVTLVSFIEPVLNPIWVFLWIGERPAPMAVVGGVLILIAIAIRTKLSSASKMVQCTLP